LLLFFYLKLVKQNELLWNRNHSQFDDNDARRIVYQNIATKMTELSSAGNTVTADDVRDKVSYF